MNTRGKTYRDHMARLLGNERRGPIEPREWHDRIVAGLPLAALEQVKIQADLSDVKMSRLLGISETKLRRTRASGSPLDPATGDRLYRLAKAIAIAEEVLESVENAMSWLRRPQPGLRGHVPLERLVTEAGADQVEELLWRIEHAVYT